jgi:Protein of unknown function (DUF2442)
MFLHVIEARYLGSYRVEVAFNNGRRGVADLAAALAGPVFEPLRNPELFAQLRVDDELETVVWPNGADLAPEYLYYLAFSQEPDLQQQFRAWGYVGSESPVGSAGSEPPPGR